MEAIIQENKELAIKSIQLENELKEKTLEIELLKQEKALLKAREEEKGQGDISEVQEYLKEAILSGDQMKEIMEKHKENEDIINELEGKAQELVNERGSK
jgi:hypothetical protein